MTNQINITKFYGDKFIKSIVFSNQELKRLTNGEFDNYIFDMSFIENLDEFVETVKTKDYLEKKEINNLQQIINYIRHKRPYKDMEEKKLYYSNYKNCLMALEEYDPKLKEYLERNSK